MSIVLVGSTSGSVTLQEPAVAGTTVLTLPAVSGTVLTTTSPKAGNVIQVVQGTDTTSYSTTSNRTTSTFSITLANSSNKVAILLWGSFDASIGTTVPGVSVSLQRSGTTLNQACGFYVVTNNGQPSYVSSTLPIMYLDTPSTTSPSYSILLNKASGSGTNTALQTGLTWILMEIAA